MCSSLITAVRNIFIQTKIQIVGISVDISYCNKNTTFRNEGTLTLASTVEEVPVIFK